MNNKTDRIDHKPYRVAAILIHPDDLKNPIYKAVLSGPDGTAYQAQGMYEDIDGNEVFPSIPTIDDRVQQKLYFNDQPTYDALIDSIRTHAHDAYLEWLDNRGPYNEIYASLRLEELRGLNLDSNYLL